MEASRNLRDARVLLRVWSRGIVRFIVVSRQ
jgi:hypothetical protein